MIWNCWVIHDLWILFSTEAAPFYIPTMYKSSILPHPQHHLFLLILLSWWLLSSLCEVVFHYGFGFTDEVIPSWQIMLWIFSCIVLNTKHYHQEHKKSYSRFSSCGVGRHDALLYRKQWWGLHWGDHPRQALPCSPYTRKSPSCDIFVLPQGWVKWTQSRNSTESEAFFDKVRFL